jgi:uncharacterized membrane protein YebE (DUF533 family)
MPPNKNSQEFPMSFDAKSLLEALMKSQAPQQPAQSAGGMGGLGDLLGSLMKGGQGAPANNAAPDAGGGMGGLGDLLGKMMQGGGGQAPAQQQSSNAPAGGMGGMEDMLRKMMQGQGGGAPAQGGGHGGGGQGGGMGGLGDILGKLGGGGGGAGAGAGNITDILGQIFSQATQGVKEVGGKVDAATGISGKARDMMGGASQDDMMAQLKDLVAKHQMGAGVAAGGLGAAVLGTRAGRSLAGSAVKVGALALIGGLAYKAFENYSQGRPLISAGPAAVVDRPAPAGTGFEPQAITNDSALLYIRAMIAAAAADGRIDENEQKKIMGGLQQVGVGDKAAHDFLVNEINNPASIDDLAAACKSDEEAVQVFTAARIAVDLDNQAENDFLVALANKLGLDGKLVQHIDAAASAQAA